MLAFYGQFPPSFQRERIQFEVSERLYVYKGAIVWEELSRGPNQYRNQPDK